MALEIIPSIDLREGRVVRLKQGDYAQQVNYDVDPVQTARLFADAGANWMHIVDLDGAEQGRPVQTDLIARVISTTSLLVQTGGGVRTTDDVKRLIDFGARRVVVGTRAIEDWEWFEKLAYTAELAGRIVLALDAKDGLIATRGWTQTSNLRAIDVAAKIRDWPMAAILYTDVSKDGMLQGPNYQATAELAEAGRVPVIASGGVGNLEHVRRLCQLPIWGAIIGRSLYEGTLDLRQAIEVARS